MGSQSTLGLAGALFMPEGQGQELEKAQPRQSQGQELGEKAEPGQSQG